MQSLKKTPRVEMSHSAENKLRMSLDAQKTKDEPSKRETNLV